MESKTNKDILEDLIDKIKEIKRIPQGKISVLAGYETENYIAEAKSTNNVSDNMIKAVSFLYERAKANPDILDSANNKITFENPAGTSIENQVEMLASYRVILSILAEIQAHLLKGKTLPTQLLNIYRKMVKDEAIQVRSELKLKV